MIEYIPFDIATLYAQNAYFIDAVVVFTLFLALAQYTFSSIYKQKGGKKISREGKLIAVAVAAALTFGYIMFAMQMGFTFAELNALAATLLFFVFGVFVYQLLKTLFGDKGAGCAAAIAYILMYSMFLLPYSQYYQLLQSQYPMVWSLFGLAYVIALVALVICVIKLVKGLGGGGGDDDNGDGNGGGKTPPKPDEDELSVTITRPPEGERSLPAGASAEIEAVIQGGDGRHAWHMLVNDQAFGAGVGDRKVVKKLPQLPAGSYTIKVIATDSNHRTSDEITLSIGTGGKGRISGKAIRVSSTQQRPRPLKDAVISLHEGDTSASPIESTTTNKDGKFTFAPLPLDGKDLVLSGTHPDAGTGFHARPPINLTADNPLVDDAEVHFTQNAPPGNDFEAVITSPQEESDGCLPSGTTEVPVEVRFRNGTAPYTVTHLLVEGTTAVQNIQDINDDVWRKTLRGTFADGSYRLVVEARDANGATASHEIHFCVGVRTVDPPQPVGFNVVPWHPSAGSPVRVGEWNEITFSDKLSNATPPHVTFWREKGKKVKAVFEVAFHYVADGRTRTIPETIIREFSFVPEIVRKHTTIKPKISVRRGKDRFILEPLDVNKKENGSEMHLSLGVHNAPQRLFDKLDAAVGKRIERIVVYCRGFVLDEAGRATGEKDGAKIEIIRS